MLTLDHLDELPALGQLIDPPRRATPTLPPGLFPNAEKASFDVPLPERVATPIVKPEDKPAPAIATPDAPKEKAIKEDKGKEPVISPAATIESSVPRDPTPAESAASKRESKHAPKAAPVQAAVPAQASAPETPVKAPKNSVEDIKPKTTASAKSSPENKAEAPLSSSKRPHPGKLNLDTTHDATKFERKENDSPAAPASASSKVDLQRPSRATSVSVTSISSRPGTPLASVVATGSPLKRTVQPRTLVIRDTPKTETPPPLPATATPASAATSTPPQLPAILPSVPSKIMSRRTSIASLNQPGTPVTERTDTMSVTSTSASRANSPPPIVGKKARKKERAKKEKEAAVDAIIATKEAPPKEDVAPIMARKTKSRKSKSAGVREGPVVVKEQKAVAPPVIKEEKGEDVVAAKKKDVPAETPASPVALVEPVKVESPTKGKARDSTPVLPPASPPREEPKAQDKTDASTSSLTAAVILQALDSTHQLALSTLNLLKPLTSQSELKKLGMDPFTSADLQNHIEQLRFELTKADEQLLKQGEAVRKDLGEQHAASRARVSGRCFVTPAGTRLSCLTKEEEEKYAEIEKRVLSEKGISRWGGAVPSHIDKSALKPKRGKLRSTLAQEDVLRALSIATESLEGALREATKGTNVKVETHLGPTSVHLAGQGLPPPTTARDPHHPQDPLSDAREYVNKFVPRMLDSNPPFVAVPAAEDDMLDDMHTGGANAGWNAQRRNYPVTHPSQLDYATSDLNLTPNQLADATLAPGMESNLGTSALDDLALPPLPRYLQHPTGSSPPSHLSTDANTAAAMDTLKEAMATAGAIAKLGASEALKNPAELLKSWDKAIAGSSNPKSLQSALEKVVRDVGVGKGGAKGASGGAMSVAELETESVKERAAEARRQAVEWEKRLNKVVRGNRKLVFGNH